MANIKFSAFDTTPLANANTRIVGYESGGTTNNQYSMNTTGIYGIDGTLAGARTVTMAGNGLTFTGGAVTLIPLQAVGTVLELKDNPAEGAQKTLAKFEESGKFFIGKSAVAFNESCVTIGDSAQTRAAGSIAIGDGANTTGNSSLAIGDGAVSTTNAVAIGQNAGLNGLGSSAVSIGLNSNGRGTSSVAVGSSAKTNNTSTSGIVIGQGAEVGVGTGMSPSSPFNASPFSVAIGALAKVKTAVLDATGGRAITINASGASATNTKSKTFKVFMTDGTTPDLDVVAKPSPQTPGSESTINTSLRVNGQAYTPLHTASSVGTGTFSPDWQNGNTQTIILNDNATIGNPATGIIRVGATYILILQQDNEGGKTVTFGSYYKFPGGNPPILTTTGTKADVITLVGFSSTVLMCTSVLDFAIS
jgi:hypothetical protein